MRHEERGQEPSAVVAGDSTDEGPAHRDASVAIARAEVDEHEAIRIRERLRNEPMPALEPDSVVGAHLEQGELVHGLRVSAILRAPGDCRALGYGGTLYLTSHRLIHIGQVTVTVQLKDVVETSLVGERLLVTLRDGNGIALDVNRPRTLRTEIAASLRGIRA